MRPRVSMVYSCCRDSAPVTRPCMVSAVTPCAVCTVRGVSELGSGGDIVGGQADGPAGAGCAGRSGHRPVR